jgi:flagellar hook-basal body complex protein FliE
MSIESIRSIGSIQPLAAADGTPAAAPPGGAGALSFADTLGQAIGAVDQLQLRADDQAAQVASGAGNLHEMALSLEKADVAMRLAVKVRNKLVDAYNEIMKMGV